MDAPPKEPTALALAADFPEATRESWQGLIAAVLRKTRRLGEGDADALAEEKLTVTTYDGVRIKPLYTADDVTHGLSSDGVPGVPPFVRGTTSRIAGTVVGDAEALSTGWDIRQRHAHPDADVSRQAAMVDLENGVTSLWLTLGDGGIPVEALEVVLKDVLLDLAPVVLDAGTLTESAATAHLALLARRGVDPAVVGGNLGADPLGLRARTGQAVDPQYAIELARRTSGEFARLRAITVDATAFADAGGSDAQELAAGTAAGVAYLRLLTDAGLDVEAALKQLEFRFSASADQFLTIAKFRAARKIWARVASSCGVSGSAGGQLQHAVTSSAMMTRRDPWVNMLRTTLAAFGAGVGGAQSVTVQPFDAALGLPDDLARRVARNTSSLLLLESNVARVIDPAGGSWYVEQLTDDLAAAAWAKFQAIEKAGGFVAALEAGVIQDDVAATWAVRSRNLAHRKDPVTGVSEFPNLGEKALVRTPSPTAAGAGEETRTGLPSHRYAEAFETLRDRAEAVETRPTVFLATIGSAAASTARATFAANLFQAGGLATVTSGTLTDPDEIAVAFTSSGAKLACLATSDKVYADSAAPVAAALKQAGAERIWLAGKAGERAESDAEAGVTGYVFAGVDALGVLGEALAVALGEPVPQVRRARHAAASDEGAGA